MFAAEDLARVRRAYPGGPQGVFLKRVTDAKGASRLVYAKAALYPALARAASCGCWASTAGCCC